MWWTFKLLTRFLFWPFFGWQSNILVINLCSRKCKSTFFSCTADWKVEQLVARHFCRMFQSILTVSGCTTWTELPLKFNELLTHLLTFYITCQVLKLELCKFHQVAVSCPAKATRRKYYNVLYVKANIKRAGKYFAGNFGRGKEWELNIPSQKCIRIIDLSAELPECWINLPPQTNSIQFNLTFDHFHMNRWGLPTGKK